MVHDTKEHYGLISKLFHWVMALLIIWQFMKFFDRINEGEHWIGQTLVPWHISIGSLLMLCVIFRIIWAIVQKNNRPEPEKSTAFLVKAGHLALYISMVMMPLSGAMLMIGNGYGWKPFGIELVARGGEKIDWMMNIGALHSLSAWIMLILVLGHVGMAFIHHFIRKDGILKRML